MTTVPDTAERMPLKIVCSALKQGDRIITGPRHYDKTMHNQINASEGPMWWKGCSQGFCDQYGEFLTRDEAYKIAVENNLIVRDHHYNTLYSEMLY